MGLEPLTLPSTLPLQGGGPAIWARTHWSCNRLNMNGLWWQPCIHYTSTLFDYFMSKFIPLLVVKQCLYSHYNDCTYQKKIAITMTVISLFWIFFFFSFLNWQVTYSQWVLNPLSPFSTRGGVANWASGYSSMVLFQLCYHHPTFHWLTF